MKIAIKGVANKNHKVYMAKLLIKILIISYSAFFESSVKRHDCNCFPKR